MADQQVSLSDEELQAAVAKGWFQTNPALLNKLDSDSRRRFVRVSAAATSEPTMGPEPGWAEKYPNAATAARGALSTLPAAGGMVGGWVGAPEGFVGALPGMALGSGAGRGLKDILTEALGLGPQTSPLDKAKGIASDTAMGAAGPLAVEGGLAALRAGAPIAARGVRAAVNASDVVDPDLVGMLSPRAGSMIRKAQQLKAKWAPRGTPAEAGPASAPIAPEAAPTPAPTPATATPTKVSRAKAVPVSASGPQPSADLSLSEQERKQAQTWMDKGVPPEMILDRIFTARKLTSRLKTPTPDEAAKEVARMVAEAEKRRQ